MNIPWDYLDTTHPDAIYLSWDSLRNRGHFTGGENLTNNQKQAYHKLWIDRLNKELKQVRGITVTDKGVQWANKAAQKAKSEGVKKLLAQKAIHTKALNKL